MSDHEPNILLPTTDPTLASAAEESLPAAPSPTVKRSYQTPTLRSYGSLRELTLSKFGTGKDLSVSGYNKS